MTDKVGWAQAMGDTVLRIHFSTEDLLRIRVAAEPHPLWEALLSLHMAQTRQGEQVFGLWRRSLRARPAPWSGLLGTLYRPKGYSPDFLTPSAEVTDLAAGLELVMSTPKRRLRADIAELAAETALPTWVRGIAGGEREPMGRLREAPVLDVAYPVDQDLHLEGRGIVLLPSFFCWSNPITLMNQFDTPVLVYPVERDPEWVLGCCTDLDARIGSLTALLGHTRTAVLRAIADRSRLNTTDLARTIGISLAGASQHATVLRNAGLVITVRQRGSALHQISARGTALLNQCSALVG